MTLLCATTELFGRRAQLGTDLIELAAGLRHEIAPLIESVPALPHDKALLSKTGGRCAADGTLLRFDPYDPRHFCPLCEKEYVGPLHDRFRLYWYQLWLAERTLHAAVLGVVTNDAACHRTSVALLEQYAEQYLRYPNVDNVLGPSRPFFSTYLESIWLLQLCLALDALEVGTPSPAIASLGARVRDRVIEPSVSLIASYDEGMSNRQVWNNAALMAASRLLGDNSMFDRAIHSPSGLQAHLGHALLSDGTWYEGENYHLFAHRGLWYGTELARAAGVMLRSELARRMQEGFAAPFRSVLPDLTFPSRRDSQYAISIRQPRFAESCELGLVRAADPRLSSMLARLYDPSVPRRETGRSASSADVERNVPATGLRRSDLSWRTLLFASPTLERGGTLPLGSDLLPAQGLGIIRRAERDVYVSLDYGESGGGHGHPDRLNLSLHTRSLRLFDDPGTGSYVDPSLHWYRSTLAHHAPLIDGDSQPRVNGSLVAFDDTGSAGWVSADVEFVPGLTVRRTIVVMQGYLIDELDWTSEDVHEITLPVHGVVLREAPGSTLSEAKDLLSHASDSTNLEDGYSFLRSVQHLALPYAPCVELVNSTSNRAPLRGYLFCEPNTQLFSADAPAPPGVGGTVSMILARATATSGTFTTLWDWSDTALDVSRTPAGLVVELADRACNGQARAIHRHRRAGSTWVIAQEDASSNVSTTVLQAAAAPAPGQQALDVSPARPDPATSQPSNELAQQSKALELPASFALGEPHYRRSECTWIEAGKPTATVQIALTSSITIDVKIAVPRAALVFIPLDADNELDNEPATINGDSVQLYAAAGLRSAGWLIVPQGRELGTRAITGWSNNIALSARWRRSPEGYCLDATLTIDPQTTEILLDVIVNDVGPGRARRRGQLVLSGARGEFVYLRGDRQEPSRLLRFSLPNV